MVLNDKKNKIISLWFMLVILVIISCSKKMTYDATISYQYLICDESKNNIKYIETFLIINNRTTDTLKIPIKLLKDDFVHVFNKDTLNIDFENIDSIFISPQDSLGLPCISTVNKTYNKKSPVFLNGFDLYNIKNKQKIKKVLRAPVQSREDFQIFMN